MRCARSASRTSTCRSRRRVSGPPYAARHSRSQVTDAATVKPLDPTTPGGTDGDLRRGHSTTSRPTHDSGYKDHLVYLAFLAIGIFVPFAWSWRVALLLLVVASFAFWIRYFRKWRAIADVPTSNIASAAQGYVELVGTVASAPGREMVGLFSRKTCVWMHYNVYEVTDKGTGNKIDA